MADELFSISLVYDNIRDESKELELTKRAHSILIVALRPDHPKMLNSYNRFDQENERCVSAVSHARF